ncbi:MAG TPA: 2-amino-4-hydroxy-6-hydroxymethyldihydropteridine diphosphokinase, partial [Bacillota bacterium]
KPEAPLAGRFEDVAVTRVRRRRVRAYLGIGANLGDRRGQLREAVRRLASEPGIHLMGVSPLYETAPIGLLDQPAFFNAVLAVDTTLFPSALLATCKRVEAAAGRLPGVRWGPRPLDVDILLYGDLGLAGPDLEIPHPRLAERAFAMRPLLDLAPDAALPGGRPLAPLAAAVAAQEIRRIAGPEWAAPEPARQGVAEP